jgi:hypothetical protein
MFLAALQQEHGDPAWVEEAALHMAYMGKVVEHSKGYD